MSEFTYRPLGQDKVTVDAFMTCCGRAFEDVALIHEASSPNPGIQITSASGIIGCGALAQLCAEVQEGKHLSRKGA